jgi:hypothetical protein
MNIIRSEYMKECNHWQYHTCPGVVVSLGKFVAKVIFPGESQPVGYPNSGLKILSKI